MCPVTPVAGLDAIAALPNAPPVLARIVDGRLEQHAVRQAINKAPIVVGSPTTGHSTFTCTIYSMHNRYFAEDTSGPEVNKNEVLPFPGEKVQDTTGFNTNTKDVAQDKSFTGLETTWKLFKECFNRNSIDGKGLEIRATIHMKRGWDNAEWNTEKNQMFFGDGGRYDGRGWLTDVPPFKHDNSDLDEEEDLRAAKLTAWLAPYSIDILGHEVTHGIVAATANLGAGLFHADTVSTPQPTVPTPQTSISTTAKTTALAPEVTQELSQLPAEVAKLLTPELPRFSKEQALALIRLPPQVSIGFSKGTPEFLDRILHYSPATEAGTLNEHIADCFGIMVKHYSQKKTAETGNWDMAPGWWSETAMNHRLNKWELNYMRTFKIPDPNTSQPDQGIKIWNDKKYQTKFYGFMDVHEAVGIGNHAFYQAALMFGGKTWEKVGRIWYNALTDETFKVKTNQTYKFWRDLTVRHAGLLFGEDGNTKMTAAWKVVNL